MKRKTDIAVAKKKLKSNLIPEGKFGNYDLFKYEDRYYAVTIKLNEKETLEVIKKNKAISAITKEELIKKIISAENWANQRGMHNINDQSETNKRYLRANSFDTYNEKIAKNYKRPIKIKTSQGLFMVDGEELNLKEKINNNFIDFTKQKNIDFINAVSVNAVPELIFMYESYNIVEYDKIFYGIPTSTGPIKLDEADLSVIKGLLKGDTVKEVMEQIRNL
tara:strand:- start:654 stop:1316 length:663 start_codon:yes stop_codon:yes gene_type:complete